MFQKISISLISLLVPSSVVFAQAYTLRQLLDAFYNLIRFFIPILIGVAFIVFVWGIIKYVISGGEKDKKEASGVIFFGVIAMTVIVGFWGIMYFLIYNFLGVSEPITIPGEIIIDTSQIDIRRAP